MAFTVLSTEMQLEDLAEMFTLARHSDRQAGQEERSLQLLELPIEIWTYICELALVRPDPIKVFNKLCPRMNAAAVAQPPITRTCKTIREQTLTLFYERHIFLVHRQNSMPQQLCCWLQAIGPTNRARLRNLYSLSMSSSLTKHIVQHFEMERAALPTVTAVSAQEFGATVPVPILHITFPRDQLKVEGDYMTGVRREAYEQWLMGR